MIRFTSTLMKELEQQLQKITAGPKNELELAEESFKAADAAMQQLKLFMDNYEFSDDAEEILFFKQIKPGFHKLLIYYAELTYIHATRPNCGRKQLITYYRELLTRNDKFFERHKLLYSYFKLGRDTEDELLYLRKADCVPLYPAHETRDIDTVFCTVNSSILAKLLAFELVNEYLSEEIEKIREKNTGAHALSGPQTPRVVWTDSQVDFVELVYALYARGSVNHGNITVKELMASLQHAFNLHVEHYYRIYAELSLRKKSRTPYIRSLGEYLERRMDDAL